MTDMTRNAYMTQVYGQLIEDLTYPVDKDGNVLDAFAIRPGIAYHLVRAGWRKPNNTDHFPLVEEFDDPVIKKRKVNAPGVYEDAVTWVSTDEPDDPLADIENMTIREIDALPADLRIEAKRRLGLLPPVEQPEEPPQPAWTVKPFITITDAEEVDESTNWTPEKE